ncbi:RNA polymerase sigma-70 factor [Muricauda sp. ANG21]|uniref:RNA polymerase sigma factor n=1 Tax=Allomuricauda sp. ANG21 TaxID=3042468 RepID=UPI003454FAE9
MSNFKEIGEKKLITALKNGDEDAFKKVYLHYYERLCVYILNFTTNRDLAQDIVQDTFLKLWNKKENLRTDGSLNSYLYKITYTNFIDTHRKDKKLLDELEEIRLNALTPLVEDHDLFEQRLKNVKLAIEKLPPRRKQIFMMNKQSGMRYKEIADQLDISIKTVENQIGKALSSIRKSIKSSMYSLFILFRRVNSQ